MVSLIDICGKKSSCLCVRSADDEVLNTHDVVLEPNRNESIDVLLDRDEHFASHVAALLGARSLVLDMDTSCTSLNEELGQLHSGSETTMTGVGIGDDGSEVCHYR